MPTVPVSPSPWESIAVEVVPIPLEVVATGSSPVEGDEASATYAVVLRNPNDASAAVRMQILVDFLDATGAFIAGEEVPVTVLPGQVTAIGGRAQDAGPAATVQVVPPEELAGFAPSSSTDETFTVDGVSTASAGGQTRTTGTITSTFATDESAVQLVAVYLDAGGKIVGGATGGVDAVPAGASVPFEIVEVSPSTPIAATEMYWQVTR